VLLRRRLCLTLLGTFVVMTVAGGAQEPYPVPVFVTHLQTPPLPQISTDEHLAASNATRSAMFERAAQLRKQHGDKTKDWPAAVWKEFYVAEDAHRQAVARADYEIPETRTLLDNSVEDFLRGAKDNKNMTMVTSAEEAALVVQITGRRRTSPPGPTDNRYFIRFRLSPGAKMTAERFDELTTGVKWDNLFTKVIQHPTAASPYVDLEAGSMASWKNCAASVRAVVSLFIAERMDPARKKSR
jgi:hypothetical protein